MRIRIRIRPLTLMWIRIQIHKRGPLLRIQINKMNFLALRLNDGSVLSWWNSAKFKSFNKGKVSQDSDLGVSDLGAELHEAGGRIWHTARQLAGRLVPTQ